MKNTIIKTLSMIAVILLSSISASNAEAMSTSTNGGVNLEVKPMLEVKRKFAKVEIVMGESEYTKRANASKPTSSTSSLRQVLPRERSESVVESYDLAALRRLYAEVAATYSIDARLVEAVHQVETGKSTDTCIRSYAGATGPFQFMPQTFAHYGNGDICNLRNAAFAAGNLLASGGADRGDIDSALFNYNHSSKYVALVKSVMNSI